MNLRFISSRLPHWHRILVPPSYGILIGTTGLASLQKRWIRVSLHEEQRDYWCFSCQMLCEVIFIGSTLCRGWCIFGIIIRKLSLLCVLGMGKRRHMYQWQEVRHLIKRSTFLNNLLSEVSNTTSYSFHHRPPKYMLIKQEIWLFDTIEACCEKNYRWKYEDCMASTAIDLFQRQLQQRMTCSIRIISFNRTSARTTDWNHLTWGMLMILSFGCTRLE